MADPFEGARWSDVIKDDSGPRLTLVDPKESAIAATLAEREEAIDAAIDAWEAREDEQHRSDLRKLLVEQAVANPDVPSLELERERRRVRDTIRRELGLTDETRFRRR